MNIEICNRCSCFPSFFSVYYLKDYKTERNYIEFRGIKYNNFTGCSFSLPLEEAEVIFSEIYLRNSRISLPSFKVLHKVENQECPYKFEHEVTNG